MTTQEKQFLNYCVDLKKQLIPYKTNLQKCRIGEPGDGGYVIAEIPGIKYDALYSYGSNDNIIFEKGFYEKYKVDSFVYDHTIDKITDKPDYLHFFKEGVSYEKTDDMDTMDNQIVKNNHQDCKNLFMQIDIEGHEWNVLASTDRLKQFSQIVVEFHMFARHPNIIKILEKINKDFVCVHIHGTNCPLNPWFDGNLPLCYEVTYVRRDLVEIIEKETESYPIKGLDFPSDYKRPDLKLDWWLNKGEYYDI